jgi:hypothetical protein
MSTDNEDTAARAGFFLIIAFWAACLGAWGTHIVFCLMRGRFGFLIAGALFFPVAIIHGWLIWLGVVS